MVSRSSTNSTSSLDTSTSVIWCDRRIIFSRLSRIPIVWPRLIYRNSAERRTWRRIKPASCRETPLVVFARWNQRDKPLSQHKLAIAGQVSLHLLGHLLIRGSGPPHFVLVLRQNLAHFVVQPIFDGQFFHHALPYALRNGFRRLGFNLAAFDQPLDDFDRHVAYIIPCEEHSWASPLWKCKRRSLLVGPLKCK